MQAKQKLEILYETKIKLNAQSKIINLPKITKPTSKTDLIHNQYRTNIIPKPSKQFNNLKSKKPQKTPNQPISTFIITDLINNPCHLTLINKIKNFNFVKQSKNNCNHQYSIYNNSFVYNKSTDQNRENSYQNQKLILPKYNQNSQKLYTEQSSRLLVQNHNQLLKKSQKQKILTTGNQPLQQYANYQYELEEKTRNTMTSFQQEIQKNKQFIRNYKKLSSYQKQQHTNSLSNNINSPQVFNQHKNTQKNQCLQQLCGKISQLQQKIQNQFMKQDQRQRSSSSKKIKKIKHGFMQDKKVSSIDRMDLQQTQLNLVSENQRTQKLKRFTNESKRSNRNSEHQRKKSKYNNSKHIRESVGKDFNKDNSIQQRDMRQNNKFDEYQNDVSSLPQKSKQQKQNNLIEQFKEIPNTIRDLIQKKYHKNTKYSQKIQKYHKVKL